MYRQFLSRIHLDMRAGETPNRFIARMQRELGATFSAIWHGYAARHPVGGKGGRGRATVDPSAHDVSTCREFLEAWRRADFDAYAMNDTHDLGVNWDEIRSRFIRRDAPASHDRPHQHRSGSGRGSHADSWSSWRGTRGSGSQGQGWQDSRGSASGSWGRGWDSPRGGESKRGGEPDPGTPGKRGKWY